MQKKKRILIVDDDTDILEVLQITLEEAGYIVKTSATGKKALTIAQIFYPDLVLLDLLLSGEDGGEICKEMKGESWSNKTSIVLISAHPEIKKAALKSGANGYIIKPFDIDTLLKVVKEKI